MIRSILTIAILLLTLLSATIAAAATTDSPQAEAEQLIRVLGCRGCHQIESNGSRMAPALDGIASRLSPAEIDLRFAAHEADSGKIFMPAYRSLSDVQRIALRHYLETLK